MMWNSFNKYVTLVLPNYVMCDRKFVYCLSVSASQCPLDVVSIYIIHFVNTGFDISICVVRGVVYHYFCRLSLLLLSYLDSLFMVLWSILGPLEPSIIRVSQPTFDNRISIPTPNPQPPPSIKFPCLWTGISFQSFKFSKQ